jgi:predicted Holliday junction resolvase-like endonuclease
MEFILTVVFVMLLLFIFYLANKIQTDREKFKARLSVLENFVIDLNAQQKSQNQQLQFSNELRERLKKITQSLNEDVFELNYQLFDENYQKRK